MPRVKSCQYCGKIHASNYNCGKKAKRYKESTDITKLRTCRKWNTMRKIVNERDHYLCRVCLLQHRLTTENLETHHIIPLVEDGSLAYDEDNLITLCAKHHKAADSGKIDRGLLKDLAQGPL